MYNDNIHEDLPFDPEMEARLWEYIDGLSTEAATIEKLIAEHAQWKAKYAELLEVHQLVQATVLEEPSLRFTKNVMEEISRLQIAPATKKYINKKIVWGIGGFFITVIVAFLVYGISQMKWTNTTSQSANGIKVDGFDFGAMFNNTYINLFLMLNVVLGLMLLDRYLNMRRRQFLEDQGEKFPS